MSYVPKACSNRVQYPGMILDWREQGNALVERELRLVRRIGSGREIVDSDDFRLMRHGWVDEEAGDGGSD
jgi:hypothetical protein